MSIVKDIIREMRESPELGVHIPKGWELQLLEGTDRWFICHHGYDIDLTTCKTLEQKLDWIRHMEGKMWVSNEMLGGLYRFMFSFDRFLFTSDYRSVLAKLPHRIVPE